MDMVTFIGREPDRLSIEEQQAMAGKWYALELYTPQTLPLKRIEAVGDSVTHCAQQLLARGLDVRRFEYALMQSPF